MQLAEVYLSALAMVYASHACRAGGRRRLQEIRDFHVRPITEENRNSVQDARIEYILKIYKRLA
jgi:hypothetical protein